MLTRSPPGCKAQFFFLDLNSGGTFPKLGKSQKPPVPRHASRFVEGSGLRVLER